MIPYGRQTIDRQDIDSVVKVLQSDFLTQGPKVLEFEQALAKACGAKYAVLVSHGTAALHLAYLAAGLGKGDEVITTPNSFVATSNMLLAVGAKPVFCDIRLDTYNIDESKIESLITDKARAIVPVHFAGQACDMDEILKIAQKHDLKVIEDACHALGASYKGRRVGSLGSDMAVFSFHPVKPITTGEGGAILTDNKKYYERLLLLRNHGIRKDSQGKNVMTVLGFNYRLTDVQAALGLSQLKKLNEFIKKRQRIAKWYEQELVDIEEIVRPKPGSYNDSGWHIYVIRVQGARVRDKLMAYLKKQGIGANFHYPAINTHPYYQKLGYKKLRLANAEEYHKTCLTLPLYPQLSRKDVEYISQTIKKFFAK